MSSNSPLQNYKIIPKGKHKHVPFPPSPYPHLCSGEGKKLRKYIASLKLEQSFILMIDERAFVDFIITGVLILSFSVHDEEIT